MKNTKNYFLSLLLCGIAFAGVAQDDRDDTHQITIKIPEVAILDLETAGSKDFNATFVAPVEAGDKLTNPGANTDLWLNYSSVVATGKTRKVDVKLSAVVPGVGISVQAAAASADGKGALGTPVGAPILLTTNDQTIVDAIGSTYTVTGASKGHQLTYTFDSPDANYGTLVAADTPVTVTYTLADN